MKKAGKMSGQQRAMLLASCIIVLLWVIPGARFISLPLMYLNTHLHETSHALACLLSGGTVDHIVVRANGSGVTWSYPLHPTLVGNAGYLGASLIGSAVIAFGRTPKSARICLAALGAILTLECALWLRGDSIGLVSGLSYAVLFFLAAKFLDGMSAVFAAQFVGLQQGLASLQSVLLLVGPGSLYMDSDATILQQQTGIPAPIWSVGWVLFSLLLMVLTFRSAWKSPKPRA